jgi:uncharacterized protein
MAFDLTDYAEAIDSALAEGAPCVVATNGENGIPDLGFKGSVLVFDKDHLAYWERTRGQTLENLRKSPGMAVLYFNRARGKMLRFFGEATVIEDGPVRDQVMARVVEPELNRDPERKGAAVLLRVDTVHDPFGPGTLHRE